MAERCVEVKVPDIGDFADVPVIEVLVAAGRRRSRSRTRSSRWSPTRRRWTSRRPAPAPSTELKVAVGDTVSEGSLILLLAARRRRTAAAPDRRRPRRGAAERRPPHRPPPPSARAPTCHAQVARARRRPGRLHGGVPRRRPRPRRGADRARRDARRRLPERRLHPVQGAAARRARASPRPRSWARTASASASPEIDLDELRGWKEVVVGKLTGGLERARQAAQGPGRPRRRRASPARTSIAVQAADGDDDRGLRALHRRRRLERRAAARPARRRPARHGLHRRARARRRPRAAARHRRRDHRPGDGDRLRRARLPGDGRRAASTS